MSETFVTVDDDHQVEDSPDAQPELVFSNAEEWLIHWALPHYRRNLKLHKWDPYWWQYEEAGTVLEALWESWEQVRLQDAMATVAWFRDYFYPIMDRLTDPEDGVFWAYDPPKNEDPPPSFETEPAPESWF